MNSLFPAHEADSVTDSTGAVSHRQDSATDYYNRALKQHSSEYVANYLGLHPNTTARWLDQNFVPSQYAPDLRRLLGMSAHSMNGKAGTMKTKDQYFTKPETAEKCYMLFRKTAMALGIKLGGYIYIEPAAGCGHFYNLLPHDKRIGIDIDPHIKGLVRADFLSWAPRQEGKYVVIGNPPFGLRGHLALQFINHASLFADMVGFILPQSFDSDGKGVPAKRVKGYKLASSHKLPPDSFVYPNGNPVIVHTIFQVWTKIKVEKIRNRRRKTCATYVKIYSLSNGGTPASTRNKAMIGKCDVYIPSTCFKGMQAYKRFQDLPNKRGYGVVIHRNRREITSLLCSYDWRKVAFPSTNSAINLRMSLIEDVITKAGYHD